MNCPGCNAPLKPGAATCLECGHAVTAAPPARGPADWVQLLIRIVKLDEAAVTEVARDPNATMAAVATIAICGAAPAIGSFAIFMLVILPVWWLITSGIVIAVVHFVARQIGGQGKLEELYRVQGLTYALHLVGVVPLLGPPLTFLAMLAQIALMVNHVRILHKMPLPNAVAAVVLPYLIFAVVAGVCFFVFGAALLALVSFVR